jgi:two-component system chemotaxis response regulator CheB
VSESGGSRGGAASRVIRVLVVDDSAVAREVLSSVLRSEGFEVATTSNATVAAQRIAHQRPDVVLLDLQMPGMSGLEFLERIMATDPLPVVVCSDIARPGAAAAIRALELGALDVIPKPSLGIRALTEGAEFPLARVIRAATGARFGAARAALTAGTTRDPQQSPAAPNVKAARTGVPADSTRPWQGRVLLLGASTGGTEALRRVLGDLTPASPPILVVQHMPAEYTAAFARRLNEVTPLQVREAAPGDELRRGVALVAPGGRQTELVKNGASVRVAIHDGPLVSGHRPSVDALFHSAARVLGPRAVAALLTGMGADGAEGLLALHRAGADTIAQDEATSIVFGMPKEAIALGAARQVLPLEAIAGAMRKVGLEPTRLAAQDPKSCASASSATFARDRRQ